MMIFNFIIWEVEHPPRAEYFVHLHYIRSDESCSLIGQRLPGIASIAAREDLTRHKEARDKMLGPERIDKE
jgi:hypothetical protein